MPRVRTRPDSIARQLALVVLVAVISAASCSSSVPPLSATPAPSDAASPVPATSPARQFGAECAAFAPDPADEFFGPTNVSYEDRTPLDWPVGTPAEAGLDEALLNVAADNAALSVEVQSLLVVRHGKLVFERYFNGSSAAEANGVHSVSKSILSVAVGIAIDEGKLALGTRIDAFLPPDLVGQHGDLTVENLLTMSGGLALSEDAEYLYDVGPSDVPGEPSFVRAVLSRASVVPAGSEFAYSTGLTQVLAAVLTKATGHSLCEYVAEHLLGPLGIDVEKWWVEPDGYFAGGHSVYITPREMARFGQFVLQGGSWDGEQLVPRSWLDLTLAERWDLGCKGVRPFHMGYGYLWWPLDVDGHLVWQASGYGSQQVWIVPDMDLVIVTTHDAANVGDANRREVNDYAVARTAIFSQAAAPRPPTCKGTAFHASTIRPDGRGRTAVPDWPDALPLSWTSDGSRIAVALDGPDLNSEIYSVAPDGTILTRLTRDLAFDNLPDWSPDGRSAAFTRGAPSTTDLYLVGADGSGLTQLTDFDGFEHSPTWSADGTRIGFVWGHGDVSGFGEAGELWVMDADGSNPELLLARSVGYPDWSADGTRIALELRGDRTHIGILDVATGRLTELGEGYAPKWSPDGARLTFARAGQESALDIYVMDAEGTNIVQLTDDAVFDTFPIWAPDGQTILFVSLVDE